MAGIVRYAHFQIASSLFLELRSAFTFRDLVKPVAPVLCLVGDIGSPYSKITKDFIRYCNTNWDAVLWVPGYHELAAKYGAHTMPIEDCIENIKDICHHNPRVQYMYNRLWKSPSDHIFLGTPLWGRNHIRDIRFRIHSNMSHNGHSLKSFQLAEMVEKNISWLDGHIEEANELNEKVICLTYSPPVFDSIINRDLYRINWMKNNLPQLIRPPVTAWIVGDLYENICVSVLKGYECKDTCTLISNSLKDIGSINYKNTKTIIL